MNSKNRYYSIKNPVFILGAPRSGTTFLGELLETLYEVEYFDSFAIRAPLAHCIASGEGRELREFFKWSVRKNLVNALEKRLQSRGNAILSFVRGNIPLSEILRRPFSSLSEIMVVYKETLATFIPQFISEAFPDAKLIHIIRDGRDVAVSMIKTYNVLNDRVLKNEEEMLYRGTDELAFPKKVDGGVVPWWVEQGREKEFLHTSQYHRCVWFWRVILERCLEEVKTSETINTSNYMEVRYEEICHNPLSVGKRILKFLGVKPTRKFFRKLKRARTSSIGRYKKLINKEDISMAEKEARDILIYLGYIK